MKLEILSFRDRFDILLKKRSNGVAELRYKMLYGKSFFISREWYMNTFAAKALSELEAQQIHQTSLKVLSEIGVDICDDKIRSKLISAGAKPGSTNDRLLFSEEMITEALGKCQRDITLSSVRKEEYNLTEDSRYYSSCLVDPFMLSYEHGKRPPVLEDCRDNARLIDALDIISMPYKMDVTYSDVPGQESVLKSNYAYMSNMSKHYICAPHNVAEARIWMEMSEIMADGPLRSDRIVSAFVSPLSPLTLDKDFLELIDFLGSYGIMLIILPCPMAGATSPFSLAGMVVTLNSEFLASVITTQTLYPGSAVFYNSVGMPMNMQTSNCSLGSPEKILSAVAGADMGRFYNIPSGAPGSSTDSVSFDIQNGAESMSQLMLAVSSCANIITGVGSLGNGNGTSAEQILFDCDLIALAQYLQKGITVDEERLGFESFKRIGPGGNFLIDELTVKLLRKEEHFLKGSFKRAEPTSPEDTMYGKLHARAREIIDNHQTSVPEKKLSQLEKYLHENLAK